MDYCAKEDCAEFCANGMTVCAKHETPSRCMCGDSWPHTDATFTQPITMDGIAYPSLNAFMDAMMPKAPITKVGKHTHVGDAVFDETGKYIGCIGPHGVTHDNNIYDQEGRKIGSKLPQSAPELASQ